MTTYADPTRCPDCHAMLPRDPRVCRVCALPLTGDTVVSLFTTLQEADRLLGVLRAQRVPAPVATGATSPTGTLLAGVERYPSPGRRPTGPVDGPRLRGASVPKILLSLGALCLLVAAVAFLAVAWGWLGVGGRTGVLVGLTAAALGVSTALHARGLRMAAESLSVVGLGLLAVDVVGVRHAGWLGSVDDARLTLLVGAVVGTGALLMLVVTARRPLVAPALLAPVAVLVAGVGAQVHPRAPWPMLVAVVLLLGLGRIGTELPSVPLQVTSIATAALGWLYLVPAGLAQAGDPITLSHLVGHLAGWPFLAATVVAAAAGPIVGVRREIALGGYALAGLVGSYGIVLPTLDNTHTAAVSALLVASMVWVGVLVTAPSRLRAAALLPLGGTLVVPTLAAADLVGGAGRAVTSVGSPFTQTFGVHVATVSTWASPLLLVPTAVTLAAAGCAAVRLVQPVRRTGWALGVGVALVLGAAATLPLYDVPLAAVVGLVLAAAVGGLVTAERLAGTTVDLARLGVLVLSIGAALLALPSDRMTTAVLAVGCAMAAGLLTRTDTSGAVAALCFPLAFTGLVWAGSNVVGVDEQLRALPVLLVLGALAIWRPQLELEVSSLVAGTFVSMASIAAARDLDVALAVYLTVAGVLVTATSIIHPSRRFMAWPGGLLLAAATWVRLLDLGVHLPEAYTLPSALVLVGVGVWRLRQDDRSATLSYLTPGRSLATVPSLVAMLDDPYSLRALLLGIACLALVVGGAALRWGAPLVVGAAVGALLALRELAPYAAQTPSWLTIGASGMVLLLIGITWENRMTDVRRASHYVAALR
ncbi:MAG TPA: hypothetical protein VH085_02480 [Nocardioides sp.]|nr:hypothetical protein [Nocardioides sp.]